MRTLYERPTWRLAKEDAECRAEWNECAEMGASVEVGIEPTVLGEYLISWSNWIGYHVRNWRCVLRPHVYDAWINLHDDPEVVETGDPEQPFVHLQGRMTGRVRTCLHCGHQQGQGEY